MLCGRYKCKKSFFKPILYLYFFFVKFRVIFSKCEGYGIFKELFPAFCCNLFSSKKGFSRQSGLGCQPFLSSIPELEILSAK